jgi:hypothetical protein
MTNMFNNLYKLYAHKTVFTTNTSKYCVVIHESSSSNSVVIHESSSSNSVLSRQTNNKQRNSYFQNITKFTTSRVSLSRQAFPNIDNTYKSINMRTLKCKQHFQHLMFYSKTTQCTNQTRC